MEHTQITIETDTEQYRDAVRLASALWRHMGDKKAMAALALALDYMPEQLAADILALNDTIDGTND